MRPNESWNFGISGSVGAYMTDTMKTRATLPSGKAVDNYDQYLLGQDASFAWRHLQLFAEVFEARFEVPNVGDADTLSYYLEAKYKITPQFFGAVRWNEQFYGNIGASDRPWGNDIWRVDAAVGYRFTNYLQTKIQYSFSHQDAPLQQGEQLIAAQLTIKF
jgi:predicted porin